MVSVFESGRSEDEPWLKEHKKHFQTQRTNFPNQKPPQTQPAPLQMSGATKYCQHCRQRSPMESFRAEKCLVCQVVDYLGPTL